MRGISQNPVPSHPMNQPSEKAKELARLLYRELEKILSNPKLSDAAQLKAVYQLMGLIFMQASQREKLPITTYFARIAYVSHQFALPKSLQFYVHQFRRKFRGYQADDIPQLLELGAKATAEVILGIYRVPPNEDLIEWLPLDWPIEIKEVQIAAFRPAVRVLVLDDDTKKEQLLARDADYPEELIHIQYHLADRNELFTPTIQLLKKVTGFPVTLMLLDVEVGKDKIYRPKAFVLEPDYLVDVSGVADGFQGKITHPWGYLLKKFLPFEQSVPLMLGNIANFYLDQLMTQPEVSFKELTGKIFALNPLAFCLFSDRQIRELMGKAQGHYVRLKQMAVNGFAAEGMQSDYCYLEPTFYSERYGLQGRLDLLYLAPEKKGRTAIVELKSGKPFMPNIHGISPNHYIQTVLYDLLVKSAFGHQTNVGCFILYSGQEQRTLRFAPTVKTQQFEALQLRNQLLAIEYLLAELGQGDTPLLTQGDRLFNRLNPDKHPMIKGFMARDLTHFIKTYHGLNELQRSYFIAFSGFIAREHRLAKTGVQGMDKLNGLASLWLDHADDKEQQYQRLAELELVENKSKEEAPVLVLNRTEKTNPLANFRQGDIAVLFPSTKDGKGVLTNQVFKCTIIALNAQQISVRLRSQQFNDRIFKENKVWNIEHDMLDGSFMSYYKGLYNWAQSLPEKRQLLLGKRPPKMSIAKAIEWPRQLTYKQGDILNQMLGAEEYFLLWGPPGTGKTSMMLHHFVRYLMEETSENIMLLAYTNRAVDEICESIERIGEDMKKHYLRIGSTYGAHADFQGQLLQNAIKGISNRKDLKALIASRRIFVGTVASIVGKTELFKLKSFDRLIIDEASQILEPLLVGLLPQFPKWILIGDHRQLPAVVTQSSHLATIKDELLIKNGFMHLGQSLFERLYLHAQEKEWNWAFAQLSHQGRMHKDIMAFPAKHFYTSQLECLPEGTPARERQTKPLSWQLPPDANILEQKLLESRFVFFPTAIDWESATQKTNQHEARLLLDLIKAFRRLMEYNDQVFEQGKIGIITPYRAQIAQIRSLMNEENMNPEDFTIDTVERYQGGARDIILISLCTNSPRQLESMSALSKEGIDRKLNVAMTRARDHLVVLGNAGILERSGIYRELMDFG